MARPQFKILFTSSWNGLKQEMLYFSENASITYLGKRLSGKKGDRYFLRIWDNKVKNSIKLKVTDVILGAKGRYVYILKDNRELIGYAFDNVVWTGIERKTFPTLFAFKAQGGHSAFINFYKTYFNNDSIVLKATFRALGEDLDTRQFTVSKEDLIAKGWGGVEVLNFEYKFTFNDDLNSMNMIKDMEETIYWNGIKVK